MAGILYGIGVGPGDPDLITLKAVKLLQTLPVIGIPHREKAASAAYQIASQAVAGLAEKELLCFDMPMTKDLQQLRDSHALAAAMIVEQLKQGKDVGMITLGDSTIYSTCTYLMERVEAAGYQTVYINGIPSFCAAAARLHLPLAMKDQELHIIPASYQIEQALKLPGIKVFMKMGKQLPKVKRLLLASGCQAKMIECCGMKDEKVYETLEQIPDQAGYYSLLMIW